jgi:hypothetical protein
MLAGAFSWRHLNAHRSDEYIVPEASDDDVTDAACPGKILLVEQQVSLPLFDKDRNRRTSDFRVAPSPVAASTQSISTSGGAMKDYRLRILATYTGAEEYPDA